MAHCFLAQLFISVYARHDTEDVVIHCIDADLGGGRARNGGRREHKLEYGVVNAREVATARRLVFLGAESEGIHIDARVGVAGVVLEGLDDVEVGSLTLGEAVLAVKLELSGDDGVLTPAVHVEGGLSEHEGAGIGDEGALVGAGLGLEANVRRASGVVEPSSGVGHVGIIGTGHLEETRGVDEARGTTGLLGATESVDGVGESIDRVRVVEGLGTKSAVEDTTGIEGRAVINVGIRLDNPDKLLAGVVEVELDLVRGAAYRLIASELHLLDEVLVGVLGHLAALISVEEDVINIEGGGNKGLLVSLGHRLGASGDTSGKGLDGPEALANGAEIKVDLDFVVLYEPLIPSLSRYLSAFSFRSTILKNENCSRGLDYILSLH